MNVYRKLAETANKLATDPDFPSGELGYTVGGVFRVIDPDDARKFFVRFPNGNFVSAFHYNRVAQKPNAPVLVRRDKLGRPEIIGVDPTKADTFFGAQNPSGSVGIHDHVRGSGREFIIDTWLLKQLRTDVIENTFQVVVAEGIYLDGNAMRWFVSQVADLTPYVPTIAGEQRWVIVGIDPNSNTLTTMAGNTVTPPAGNDVTPDLIPLVQFLGTGNIPLSAVYLRYGDLFVQRFQIEDLRHLAGYNIAHLNDLLDVDTANALSGYVLSYDGSKWIAAPDGGGGGLVLSVTDGATTVIPTTSIYAGDGLAVTDNGGGQARIDNTVQPIEITDGTTSVDPLLTLRAGAGVTLIDNGSGEAEIRATAADPDAILDIVYNGTTADSPLSLTQDPITHELTFDITLTAGDIPNLPASKITSGTFDTARIPNLDAGKITSGTLNAARIPNLDAGKITSGVLPVARGGTGTDMSVTGGGTLVQSTTGANVTVRKDNLTASTAPTVTDDASIGYSVGSVWIDTTNEHAYIAISVANGAAVWVQTDGIPNVGYSTIQDNGVDLAQRIKLNFTGNVITSDDAVNNVTTVDIPAGAGITLSDGSQTLQPVDEIVVGNGLSLTDNGGGEVELATSLQVSDGIATVNNVSRIEFVSGAIVGASGNTAHVDITGGGGGGGGSMTRIGVVDVATPTPSITFSSIPQTFDYLLLKWIARSSRATVADVIFVELNSDASTSNYRLQSHLWGRTHTQEVQNANGMGRISGASDAAGMFGQGVATFNFYTRVVNKYVYSTGYDTTDVSQHSVIQWLDTSPITSITVHPMTGQNFVVGTYVELIGVRYN